MKSNNILNNPQPTENKTQIIINEQVKEAKVVVLKPIGYPFTATILETPQLEVENKELFELYARDQWNGYVVKEGHYIFDQNQSVHHNIYIHIQTYNYSKRKISI